MDDEKMEMKDVKAEAEKNRLAAQQAEEAAKKADNAPTDMWSKLGQKNQETTTAPTAAAPAPAIKHIWTREDTYASLAQQYYGSIKEPYWRLIYDHNKEIIGDHPNNIRVGLEIEIPPLPDELKKK